MNSTKETWDDILEQCRTWIQELTVAKFQYNTFNNSALQRRSQGRNSAPKRLLLQRKCLPSKTLYIPWHVHSSWLELKRKKLCKFHDQKRSILIKAKYSIRPVMPHLSAHCCHFYFEQFEVIQYTPLLQTMLRTSEHTHTHFTHLYNEPFGLK